MSFQQLKGGIKNKRHGSQHACGLSIKSILFQRKTDIFIALGNLKNTFMCVCVDIYAYVHTCMHTHMCV